MKSSYTSKSARVRLHCICKTIFFCLEIFGHKCIIETPCLLPCSFVLGLFLPGDSTTFLQLFPVCQYFQLSFHSYIYSALLLAFSHQKCNNQVCLSIYFSWSLFWDIVEHSRSNNLKVILKRRNFLNNILHR